MIGKTISHYKILEKLGEGGMGVVYRAEDTKLDRSIALKFLSSSIAANETDKQRFIVEAKAAAALNHPNIATIHSIEEMDGELFIVMEYIEGKELKDILPKILSLREVNDYVKQIAAGLQTAHDKGIIHRDIKSSNIMITESGQIKILDFGLAKIGDGANLTKDNSTLGTLAYMAPEQIQGKTVDARADVFSFGVLLFEMLTGKLPFQGDFEAAMMYSILSEEPKDVRSLRPDCPDYMADLIGKCLQKEPDDRFGSMQEIIQAIESETKESHATGFKRKESGNYNLPLQLTSFIGRKDEIENVHKLIESNRLVTLTGAGGCGKTRLSMEVARQFVSHFTDGVWFIELASISDGKEIPESIANVLKIKEEPKVPLIDTICNMIAAKTMLLVIDNCEHVIQEATDIVIKLLQTAEGISILTTSREALNAPGEIAWRVPSLSLPDIDNLPKIDALEQFEAIELFIDRAKTSKPNLQLSDENKIAIAKICRRLDGIPLAIELAAARIKLLGPNDILNRLDNRFQLLTGGRRSALDRQKTLRATVDWSYELLSEKEKTLFNRLSVFVSGCDLEAVEAVCGTDPIEPLDIVDLLSALIDKSLVIADTQKDGSIRYRLLESIRHYGGEKLLQIDEANKVRDAHFKFFLELSESAYQTWLKRTGYWVDKLNIEYENLRIALQWSKDKPLKHLRMAGYLHMFWFESFKFHDGFYYLKNAITKHRGMDEETARALTGYQRIGLEMGQSTEEVQEEIINIWRKIDKKYELGSGLLEYVLTKCVINDLDQAIDQIDEAVEIFNELQEDHMLLRAETIRGFVFVCLEQPERALPIVEKNLEIAKRLDAQWDYYFLYHYYGDAAVMLEDFKNAESRFGIALKAAADSGNTNQAAYELIGIANSVSGQKRYKKALRLYSAFNHFLVENDQLELKVDFWEKMRNKHLANARESLGVEAEKYEQEGRDMGFEKAVRYALDFDAD